MSCDNEQDILVKFLEKEPMPWEHWFDGQQGAVAKTFRVRAFPTLYLIDHTGFIYLMGGSGEYLGFFPPGTSADRMVEIIRQHLTQRH